MATIIPIKIDASGNLSQFTTGDMLPSNIIPGGAGSGPTEGVAIIDFGAAPGGNVATTQVSGLSNINSATSLVKVAVRAAPTVEHNEIEHMVAPIRLTASSLVTGVGFTINAISDWRLSGTFNVQWSFQ